MPEIARNSARESADLYHEVRFDLVSIKSIQLYLYIATYNNIVLWCFTDPRTTGAIKTPLWYLLKEETLCLHKRPSWLPGFMQEKYSQ